MAIPINNSASATYAYGNGTNQDSVTSNTATTNLITEYAMSAVKGSLNTGFRAGQNLTYYVHISNEGTSPLYNVTVSDDLGGSSRPLTYVDSSASLNVNGTISSITPTTVNPLTFVLPNPLSSGDLATITFVTQVSSSLSDTVTEIVNTATVQANEGSASGSVLSISPSPTVTLPIEDYASVAMTKAVSASVVNVNEDFSYTLTLTNSGNTEATDVVVTDVLPSNFIISSITSETNGVQTTYSSSDYSINSGSNTLTLPSTSSSLSISVPAKTTSGNGTTTITITGSITS